MLVILMQYTCFFKIPTVAVVDDLHVIATALQFLAILVNILFLLYFIHTVLSGSIVRKLLFAKFVNHLMLSLLFYET